MHGLTGHRFALKWLGGDGLIGGRRPLLLRRVREERCGLLEPRLVSRFDGSGICFTQGVFERKASLRPGQEIVAA